MDIKLRCFCSNMLLISVYFSICFVQLASCNEIVTSDGQNVSKAMNFCGDRCDDFTTLAKMFGNESVEIMEEVNKDRYKTLVLFVKFIKTYMFLVVELLIFRELWEPKRPQSECIQESSTSNNTAANLSSCTEQLPTASLSSGSRTKCGLSGHSVGGGETLSRHGDSPGPSEQKDVIYSEEEREEQRRRLECKICLQRMVSVVFLPCNHMVACERCSMLIRRCPVCRAYVKGTTPAFFI